MLSSYCSLLFDNYLFISIYKTTYDMIEKHLSYDMATAHFLFTKKFQKFTNYLPMQSVQSLSCQLSWQAPQRVPFPCPVPQCRQLMNTST